MAKRPIRSLSDMEIDEISLVDKGANQHAMITIAKRATEEDEMPDLYNEDGSLVDENALSDGDIVYDAEGNAYQFELGAEGEGEDPQPQAEVEKEKELAVAKSAFGKKATRGFADDIREQLSKAFSDDERDEVLSKAFSRIDEIQKRYEQAESIAKAERDLRLTREYIAKAAEYNLPVDPTELGPVLYRMAETMSYDDCAVIAKCLESTGEILFTELGFQGGGDNGDVMDLVQAQAIEIGKAATPENISKVFDENPAAYDEYLSAQRGR